MALLLMVKALARDRYRPGQTPRLVWGQSGPQPPPPGQRAHVEEAIRGGGQRGEADSRRVGPGVADHDEPRAPGDEGPVAPHRDRGEGPGPQNSERDEQAPDESIRTPPALPERLV